MQNPNPTFKLTLLVIALILGVSNFATAQNKKIDSLEIELKKQKSEVDKIPVLLKLSQSLTSVDPDKKYVYARQMRDIAEKYKIDTIIPVAYLDMAMTHGIKSNYDSSMYYFSKGLALAKQKKVASQEARAYVGIGYTYDRLDDPKAAIENYELALKIFKKTNHQRGLNQTLTNLGSIYFDLNEFKIAESYFMQVLSSFEKLKDQPGIAYGNFILGNTSRALNKDTEAYNYYTKSLSIREKLEDINGIALANFGLGELYLKQEKYAEAEKVLLIAVEKNHILNNTYQEAVALNSLAKAYLGLKNVPKANQMAELGYKNAVRASSKGLRLNALDILITLEKEAKNYKKAFDYQSEAVILQDSLNLEKVKKEFIFADFKRMRTENTDLETTNEIISSKNLTYKRAIYIITTLLAIVLVLLFLYLRKIRQKNKINKILEKQKAEISSINSELESVNDELTAQNDLTKKQKEELERINAVKNKFFSIVSHDLRSPIATLKMLFSSYFSGYLTQEEMDDLLKKLEETIFNTADFLDNLLEWSKSQLEGMMVYAESFQIGQLIIKNLKILNPQIIEKQLKIENNVDEAMIAYADMNMINVVFRNILSNSIKFCKSGDSIIVNSVVKENFVLISIKDTGVGIELEEQKKIFQLEHTISQGTSGEKGHHIGLVLCKDMVEQNGGKISFESTVGEGTTFFIEIPKNKI